MSPFHIPVQPSNLAEMDTGEVRKDQLFQERESSRSMLKPLFSMWNIPVRPSNLAEMDTGEVRKDQLFQELESMPTICSTAFVCSIGVKVFVPASVTKECWTDTGEVLKDQWFLKRNPCFLPTSRSKKKPVREIEKDLENPTGRWSPWDQPNNVTLTEKYERNPIEGWSPATGKIYVANLTGRQSPDWDRPYMSNRKMMPVGKTRAGESFSGNKFMGKGSFKRMKYDTWQQLVLKESLGLCDTSQPEEELMRAIRKCLNMRKMLQHQAWINVVP